MTRYLGATLALVVLSAFPLGPATAADRAEAEAAYAAATERHSSLVEESACARSQEGEEKALNDADKKLEDAFGKIEDARKKLDEATEKEQEGKTKDAGKKRDEALKKLDEAAKKLDEAEVAIEESGGCEPEPAEEESPSASKQEAGKKNGGGKQGGKPGASSNGSSGRRGGKRNADAPAGIKVDGFLEGAYGAGFAELTYTRDSGAAFTGLLSVVEDDEYYYFGFQQTLAAKSNAYCSGGDHDSCYQGFDALVGSDYIAFEWGDIRVPIDIISEAEGAPSGYIGGAGTGDGGDIEGIDASAVRAKSAMDYNLNVLGWSDLENSPNFAGVSFPGYIYPSIAEVRIRKDAFPAGVDPRAPVVVVHNSPAPDVDFARFISLTCPDGRATGLTGQIMSLSIVVVQDGTPVAGQPLLALMEGSGRVVSVGGSDGSRGSTGAGGSATIEVTASSAGTGGLRVVLDLNEDGAWDPAVEPSTEPVCPVRWRTAPVPLSAPEEDEVSPVAQGAPRSPSGPAVLPLTGLAIGSYLVVALILFVTGGGMLMVAGEGNRSRSARFLGALFGWVIRISPATRRGD